MNAPVEPTSAPPLISATLIWDGAGEPEVPKQLWPVGRTREEGQGLIDQMQQLRGTPMEVNCEIAGRACYDSLGRGRTSAGYHQHILEVKHLSTVEHGYFTVALNTRSPDFTPMLALPFINRPNVWVCQVQPYELRVTLNLRHVLEWDSWKPQLYQDPLILRALGYHLKRIGHQYAPQIVQDPLMHIRAVEGAGLTQEAHESVIAGALLDIEAWFTAKPSAAQSPEECWATLLLTGSRGFSHEQVRHGDFTAISQRSTRFVDEADSPWVEHPLLTQYLATSDEPQRASNGEQVEFSLRQLITHGISAARTTYRQVVDKLEPWLIARGVDKVTARKQARGAARGYLGNALYTEVVFSASIQQWRRMLLQRLNAAADAEIRQVYQDPVALGEVRASAAGALSELKRSVHRNYFNGWNTIPSPDGIGVVLDTANLPGA